MRKIRFKKGKQYILPRTICLLVICIIFFGLYSAVSAIIGVFADKPTSAPTPTPEATAEPTEAPELVIKYEFHGVDSSVEAHDFGDMMPKRVKTYTQADTEALASLCMAEASCCPEWEQRAVVDTVLNRVDNPQFRSNILSECHSGEFNAGDGTWTDKIMLLVLDELEDWSYSRELTIPSDYCYFWGNHGNSFDEGWHNYFYNDYAVWETEAHVSTTHAYEWR